VAPVPQGGDRGAQQLGGFADGEQLTADFTQLGE
jgi:hypothetical protein